MVGMMLIRKATKADMPAVHGLIRELASFEKAPDAVTNNVVDMIEDCFGTRPVFGCHVAELDGLIVGMAIYFIKYSTWKGKGLYLDDLIVTEKHRGKGIGRKLFDAYVQEAKAMGANQLHWQVLDWNTPAIEFYKKLGANIEAEWLDCKINKDARGLL
jgi:GNAT superfamily N-acetyltransferase